MAAATVPAAHGQVLDHVIGIGGGSFDSGEDIAIDDAGNSYVTGRYSGTVDFDPGPGVFALTSAGAEDVFVARYRSDGSFAWAVGFGGALGDIGHAVDVDAAGNVYISGRFRGTANFDPEGSAFRTSNGGEDFFIAKYDRDGAFQWVVALGSDIDDSGEDLAVDAAGNVYITGGFQGTIDFDPGPGVTSLTSEGGLDIYRARYDTNGNMLWAFSAPAAGNANQRGFRLVADDAGYSYISGWFKNNPEVDNVGGGTLDNVGKSDIWLGKFDPNGDFVWAFNIGSPERDLGLGIAVDSQGNTIGGGKFRDTADFDPGPGEAILTNPGDYVGSLAKYTPDGDYIWAFLLDNISSNGSSEIFNVAVDEGDNIYITGYFGGTIDFDPVGTYALDAEGSRDGFVAKYDPDGQLVWAFPVGGESPDIAYGIAYNAASGKVVVTGQYRDAGDFSVARDGSGVLTSNGLDDMFLAQYAVGAGNPPPVARFTVAEGPSALELAFDASASTDNGSVVGWAWDFGDGATGTGETMAHTYAAAGTYTVTLTVTDDEGATGSANQSVDVGNPPPVAAFTAVQGGVAPTIDFDGSASSDDGAVVGWAWDFGDGATGTGETTAHSYAAPGTYTVTLTVTDDEGATGAIALEVDVLADQPPTASFSAAQVGATLQVDFDGSASTDDSAIVQYDWDFGDGATASGSTASHTYAAYGTYTVTLTVTDDGGNTGMASSDIAVTESSSGGPFLEVDGLLVFEAEHHHLNIARSDHSWTEDTGHAGFSGASALRSDPDDGTLINDPALSPELAFDVEIGTTGDYYIWARVWAPNRRGQTAMFGFDAAPVPDASGLVAASSEEWEWAVVQRARTAVPLSIDVAGVHSVHVWMREDGLLIDKVLMTTDAAYVPTGEGPAESPRGVAAQARGLAIDGFAGVLSASDERVVQADLPREFALEGNYPNPFQGATRIRFALPAEADVHLTVFDALGREVQTLVHQHMGAGRHEVAWDASAVPSGVYLYRFSADGFEATKRLVVLR